MEIIEAASAEHIGIARDLFEEYQSWFGLPLCFQNFDDELTGLPGDYAPPEGRLFLAFEGGSPAGCAALRNLGDGACEMKRLYVRDDFRGHGVGIALIERLLAVARAAGYTRVRLDTYPPRMAKAVSLYESLGFREIEPYYHNPYGETLFMELEFRDDRS
jgi:GNAT superfamily N-acetyltransferase